MPRKILILFLLLIPLCAHGQSTLLVLGDSLSAAYGIKEQEGWVALLATRLKTTTPAYQVTNASISGETTAGGLTRLPQLLQEIDPRIVIIALGANDGLRGLSLKDMRHNLRQMIELSQQHGSRVLLVGMELPPNYGPAYSQLFHQSFEQLAEQEKVTYHPFLLAGLGEKKELFQADGLHPVAAAQPQILDNIWSKLETMIR